MVRSRAAAAPCGAMSNSMASGFKGADMPKYRGGPALDNMMKKKKSKGVKMTVGMQSSGG